GGGVFVVEESLRTPRAADVHPYRGVSVGGVVGVALTVPDRGPVIEPVGQVLQYHRNAGGRNEAGHPEAGAPRPAVRHRDPLVTHLDRDRIDVHLLHQSVSAPSSARTRWVPPTCTSSASGSMWTSWVSASLAGNSVWPGSTTASSRVRV